VVSVIQYTNMYVLRSRSPRQPAVARILVRDIVEVKPLHHYYSPRIIQGLDIAPYLRGATISPVHGNRASQIAASRPSCAHLLSPL
jgi:hypothetical protein